MQINVEEINKKEVDWNYVITNRGCYRVDDPRSKTVVINNGFGIVAIIAQGELWTIHNNHEFTEHCSHWERARHYKCDVNIDVTII